MGGQQAPIPAPVLARLKEAAGAGGFLEDPGEAAPYLEDVRGIFHGRAALVLRPACTEAVAECVALCAEAGIGVVPQGGNTGLVGGSVPGAGGGEVLLSLDRMTRVRAVDPREFTITVEAGCLLAEVQRAAAEVGRLFPLSLAAEGSCRIGGNLSTNAGGTAVLRYGNARDLVLGLEVVLPDGRVWDGLRGLRKDNTGYDLKQLFLGAEGTLGVITAAVLKLFPAPRDVATAWVAVPGPGAALDLLARLREASGDAVVSFEYLPRLCVDLVLEHLDGIRDPLARPHQHYVLLELASSRTDAGLGALLERALAAALDEGLVEDATIAASSAQRAALWAIREGIPEAQNRAGGTLKHDVSVPLARVPEFLERATRAVEAVCPGVRAMGFGHLGDGNVHYNLVRPPGEDERRFLARGEAITPLVHEAAEALGGSFSAEHGIGVLKRADLARYRGGVELELMRTVKRALDPRGIMNPGKVL